MDTTDIKKTKKSKQTNTPTKIMKNQEKLLIRLLNLLIQIRIYHWQTYSNARHQAAGELYDNLNINIDKFVETYSGKYNRIYVSNNAYIPIGNTDNKSIVKSLLYHYKQFKKDIHLLLDPKTDSDLLAISDDILNDINKTIYLFTLK